MIQSKCWGWRGEDCHSRILYSAKLFLKIVREINIFQDKQMLREFTTTSSNGNLSVSNEKTLDGNSNPHEEIDYQ